MVNLLSVSYIGRKIAEILALFFDRIDNPALYLSIGTLCNFSGNPCTLYLMRRLNQIFQASWQKFLYMPVKVDFFLYKQLFLKKKFGNFTHFSQNFRTLTDKISALWQFLFCSLFKNAI